MDNTKIIFLYRHGETDWNVKDITLGQLEGVNTSFTKLGYKQLIDIKENMKLNNIEVIYTSDFNRTLDTAEFVKSNLNLPVIISKELRGLNMGDYQGKPFKKFIESEDVKKSLNNHSIPFKNGESIDNLIKRYITFIKRICISSPYNRIAIISHSAAISNLKAFINSEPYLTLKMCCITLKEDKFKVLDYVPAKEFDKELIVIKNDEIK